jgi:hypothetical protein
LAVFVSRTAGVSPAFCTVGFQLAFCIAGVSPAFCIAGFQLAFCMLPAGIFFSFFGSVFVFRKFQFV